MEFYYQAPSLRNRTQIFVTLILVAMTVAVGYPFMKTVVGHEFTWDIKDVGVIAFGVIWLGVIGGSALICIIEQINPGTYFLKISQDEVNWKNTFLSKNKSILTKEIDRMVLGSIDGSYSVLLIETKTGRRHKVKSIMQIEGDDRKRLERICSQFDKEFLSRKEKL